MSEQDNPQEVPEVTVEEEVEQLLSETEVANEPDDINKDEIIAKKDSIIRQLTARIHEKKSSDKITPKSDDDLRTTVQQLALAEEKRQFGFTNNLTPDEADYIFRVNPKPTKELLDDPFIKGGLQAVRAKRRAESNTPSLTSRSPSFALPKKEDLTPDEKQEAFEKFMTSKKNKGVA